MSHYIRPKIPGATIFFTVNLADRTSTLLIDQIDLLRTAVRKTKSERPFCVDAWVVLPNHMHAVWTLPDGDSDYSVRWSIIKARFSIQVDAGHKRQSHFSRREKAIWQRRFWEHHIRDEDEYRAYVNYCLINPVKHGYAKTPEDWPYSSIHR